MNTQQPFRINPGTLAAQWHLQPVALAWPCRDEGPSAAAFAGHDPCERQFDLPPDPHTHVLTVISTSFHLDLTVDGRAAHHGTLMPGGVHWLHAGQTPRAVLRGGWSLLHLYLPADDLRLLAEDMGHSSTGAAALAFSDLGFARDAFLSQMGLRLERRMRAGDAFSRLELDELALRIGERLLRHHALSKPPKARRRAGLSPREQSLAREFLADAPRPGMAGLSRLLDRNELQALAAFEAAFRAAPADVREALLKGRAS